jgi:hypothetical protein
MKGGRPPMAPNRLSRKRAMQLCADKESPLDIMFDNMLFWHRQSKDLGAKLDAICRKIKNEDDRREAISLARTFLSARENAQRCAVDCAPYVHAKLQAVQHEHGPTGMYLISDRPLSESEWREKVGATVIDVTPEDASNGAASPGRIVAVGLIPDAVRLRLDCVSRSVRGTITKRGG